MANSIFSRGNGEAKTKRLLVLVKGDPVDEEALRLAYTYAIAKKDKGRHVAVEVVYVVEVPHSLPLEAELPEEVEKGEEALDHAETKAREMGLEVEASILQARSAGAAVVDLARSNGAELIVLAVRHHMKLGELELGRTLPYVLKNAPCRVWICRAPISEEEPPQ